MYTLSLENFLDFSGIATDNISISRKTRKILLRILRTNFKNQKRAVLGPDLSNREKLIKTVLSSKRVGEAIVRESFLSWHKKSKARKKLANTQAKYAPTSLTEQ